MSIWMLGLLRFAVTMSSRELPPVFRARPDKGGRSGTPGARCAGALRAQEGKQSSPGPTRPWGLPALRPHADP